MESCLPIVVAAALLLATGEPKQCTKDDPSPAGWSFATEGSGIPGGQSTTDYVVRVDHDVIHGGRAAVSLRSAVASPSSFRAVTQLVKADAYRGKRVRLAGYLKTRDVAVWSGLWLRVDGPARMLAFDNMRSRPVKGTTDWTRYEVVLDVPEAALEVVFGPVLEGVGQVWADDLTLEVVDPKEIKATQPAITFAERVSNLDFETAGHDADEAVAGWSVVGDAHQRTGGERAHGGRAYLELKSTREGATSFTVARQEIDGGPYRGKRVRFRAYFKAEGVAEAAYASVLAYAPTSMSYADTSEQGLKGTTDWRPHDVVIDLPADAEGLSIGVFLKGAGTLGVDDASLEVVDPAEVPLNPKSGATRINNEERVRKLAAAVAGLPDRPQNLDFER